MQLQIAKGSWLEIGYCRECEAWRLVVVRPSKIYFVYPQQVEGRL